MSQFWMIPVALAVSFCLTAALRRYALARSLLDIPNARSSHSIPTPRGGGVAVVLTFLLMLLALRRLELISPSLFLALMGAGAGVAVIGFLDDHGHIAARWRLLGHFLAAGWALYWLGGMPVLPVFGISVDLGVLGTLVGLVFLVWMLNLYNFMDGIDGIAGVQAVTACFSACLLYGLNGYPSELWVPLFLALAVCGFLCWNFPPARIFMGDAGSGFLGIVLGVLSLHAASFAAELFWCWLVLLGVFVVDATATLLRRLVRGDKVYEAHRTHAYQYASRHYGRHLPVTLAVALINVFWLLPIAVLCAQTALNGVWAVLLAYAPLVALALRFHAGKRETNARER
ncbi:MraY family glycosyltransferase [Pseudomonas cremoricolorata]|uniref:Glycosyl transferase n=1 Tax=Pseudomonas cremoricolorata TaxID=157783 RepID=A0A089WKW9_9PSED|nr:glycosyltransferase family 4 protein [Pseudomonas cremoricolorata]AIR89960.1 glycosyl transferase [Pseudomonas cremoricolorata]